jgi:hypothetical protein
LHWIEKLARELQDNDYISVESPVGPGMTAAEEARWRIMNESTDGNADAAREAAAEAARQAGLQHPNDPAKVKEAIQKAFEDLKKKYANQKQTQKWIEDLEAALMDKRYVSYTGPTYAANGSTLVFTGTVTEGEMATASVIGPNGATLSGVVVEVDGEEYVSDSKGRIVFPVAVGLTTLVATLPGSDGVASRIPVVSPSAAPVATTLALDDVPSVVQNGQNFPVSGSGFSGDAEQNTVALGDQEVSVLAASPSELVVAAPAGSPLGSQPLTVSNAQGSSEPVDMTVIGMRLESGDTALHTGQKGRLRLVVEGTDAPVPVTVTNRSPQVVHLEGGESMKVVTSGGADNSVPVGFRAVGPGGFELSATLTDSEQ